MHYGLRTTDSEQVHGYQPGIQRAERKNRLRRLFVVIIVIIVIVIVIIINSSIHRFIIIVVTMITIMIIYEIARSPEKLCTLQ